MTFEKAAPRRDTTPSANAAAASRRRRALQQFAPDAIGAAAPLADPPYLFAVALFEYGAAPRCWGLWFQLLFPRLTLLWLIWLKLLLTLMLTLPLCPQPQPQHDPPQNAAPIITPKLNETNAAPGG
jgi:hypothetical protein